MLVVSSDPDPDPDPDPVLVAAAPVSPASTTFAAASTMDGNDSAIVLNEENGPWSSTSIDCCEIANGTSSCFATFPCFGFG